MNIKLDIPKCGGGCFCSFFLLTRQYSKQIACYEEPDQDEGEFSISDGCRLHSPELLKFIMTIFKLFVYLLDIIRTCLRNVFKSLEYIVTKYY